MTIGSICLVCLADPPLPGTPVAEIALLALLAPLGQWVLGAFRGQRSAAIRFMACGNCWAGLGSWIGPAVIVWSRWYWHLTCESLANSPSLISGRTLRWESAQAHRCGCSHPVPLRLFCGVNLWRRAHYRPSDRNRVRTRNFLDLGGILVCSLFGGMQHSDPGTL